MDHSSSQYQPPPPPPQPPQAATEHHQSYEAYYNQYYQQQQPYPPYYTQQNTPNNLYYNHPQSDESVIYPPGVTPPVQQIPQNHYYDYSNSAVVAPPVPVHVSGGTHYPHHHHHTGEMGPTGHHMVPQVLPQPSYVRKMPGGKSQSGSSKVKPPKPMAWCELCRVDCNSFEILEQHKSGKKHQKNLKSQNELENLNKVLVQGPIPQNPQNPEVVSQDVEAFNTERGLKRKKKKNKGGANKKKKSVVSSSGTEGPTRVNEVVTPVNVNGNGPFICEICEVKCESNVTFQSHILGRKHIGNVKRFHDQQSMIEQAALQALYPALQALYPEIHEICKGDIGALVNHLQQQGVQGIVPQSGPPTQGQSSMGPMGSEPGESIQGQTSLGPMGQEPVDNGSKPEGSVEPVLDSKVGDIEPENPEKPEKPVGIETKPEESVDPVIESKDE